MFEKIEWNHLGHINLIISLSSLLYFALCFCLPITPLIILTYSVHLLVKRFGQMSATLTIIDFAEMMQPYHAYNAAAMTIVHNSQKIQCSVLLLQCLYTANDKYPAAIHTSNRVYTTSTQHTQLLYFYQLYQLDTGAREYKAFSSPSKVILHIISYIALCSYYLFASTQKDHQAPTIRAQFTKVINKHKTCAVSINLFGKHIFENR